MKGVIQRNWYILVNYETVIKINALEKSYRSLLNQYLEIFMASSKVIPHTVSSVSQLICGPTEWYSSIK
jgi:hypothetical protein